MTNHFYTTEDLILINRQIERSRELEDRQPGALTLFILGLTIIVVVFAMLRAQPLYGIVWGLVGSFGSFVTFYYAVVLWQCWTQLRNLPIRSREDVFPDEDPPEDNGLGFAADSRPAAAELQTRSNQIKRPNFSQSRLTRDEWNAIRMAVRENNWRISRPLIENEPYNVDDLTTYIGNKTRYRVILDELEAAEMLVGSVVPERAQATWTAPTPSARMALHGPV